MNRSSRVVPTVTLALLGFTWPVVAEVIVYDNAGGEFLWVPYFPFEPPTRTYLDPLQPPSQTGELITAGLVHYIYTQGTSGDINYNAFFAEGPIELAAATDGPLDVRGEYLSHPLTPAQEFQQGQTIGPDAFWAPDVAYGCSDCSVYTEPEEPFDILPRGLSSSVSWLSSEPFIGFRSGSDGEFRYGWIELRHKPLLDFGLYFQPVRWAYETELNTPIRVIPEPASICSLLLCVLFATSLPLVRRVALR
jgi:hypothetical protein